jgi:hypothetical protein
MGRIMFKVDRETARIYFDKLMDMHVPFTIWYEHPAIFSLHKKAYRIPMKSLCKLIIRFLRFLNRIVMRGKIIIQVRPYGWKPFSEQKI